MPPSRPMSPAYLERSNRCSQRCAETYLNEHPEKSLSRRVDRQLKHDHQLAEKRPVVVRSLPEQNLATPAHVSTTYLPKAEQTFRKLKRTQVELTSTKVTLEQIRQELKETKRELERTKRSLIKAQTYHKYSARRSKNSFAQWDWPIEFVALCLLIFVGYTLYLLLSVVVF